MALMNLLPSLVLIGLALAMDCLAVSFTIGACQRTRKLEAALILGLMFGLFQAGMTLLGWLLGSGFASSISAYDHVVASALLFLIGAKMIIDGIRDGGGESPPDIFSLPTVILLAVATSIDALAIGISFAFLQVSPILPAVVIGVIAAGVSVIGVFAGGKAGRVLGRRVDIIGGVILILIGIRILVEHTMA
ncbi:MAG: manganese efflux pump MntP family protein [Methanoregulaceae archaeon]|jgi:putative Mn2+ efflux pump MntP|nr:manganese efflux pump MntP family protein [Methanoregulaceae archaeon]